MSNDPAPDIPHRNTFDLMVLLLTGTVCASILLTGAVLAVLAVVHPDRDYSEVVKSLFTLLGTITGALLGWLAGKAERPQDHERRP